MWPQQQQQQHAYPYHAGAAGAQPPPPPPQNAAVGAAGAALPQAGHQYYTTAQYPYPYPTAAAGAAPADYAAQQAAAQQAHAAYYQQYYAGYGYQYPAAATATAPAVAGTAPAAAGAAAYPYPAAYAHAHAHAGYPYQQQPAINPAMAALPPTAATSDDEAEADDERQQQKKNDSVPTASSNAHFNMDAVLAQNILASDYWRKNLSAMTTMDEVIDEIYNQVSNIEPFCVGMYKNPSTAFCLLFKMCTLGVSRAQLRTILNHSDSPFIRAIGLLFLRYALVHELLWEHFEPLLDDAEAFAPGFDAKDTTTIGKFAERLLRDKMHSNTMLPRIKETVRRDIEKRLLERELGAKRGGAGGGGGDEKSRGKFKEGMKISAQWSEDAQWYDAVIVAFKPNNRFLVEFTAYGNSEVVDATALRLLSGAAAADDDSGKRGGGSGGGSGRSGHSSQSRSRSRSRDRRRSSRSRSRSRSPGSRHRGSSSSSRSDSASSEPISDAELERIIRERARNAAATSGRDYARKVPSIKMGLALPPTVGTARRRSKSPPRASTSSSSSSSAQRREESPPRPKQPSAEHAARMQKLKEMYGDVSSKDKK